MLTIRKHGAISLALIASFLLIGCGGGTEGGAAAPTGPVTSTLSFPLLQAHKTGVANGVVKTFVVSGACIGTANMTNAPATTPAVFEANQAALSAVYALTATLSNAPGIVGCPATFAVTGTQYWDSNYTPLGHNSVGVSYGVFLTAPIIPATVLVGGAGVLGTETIYTDITKAVPNGRDDSSYVIEADTATTAIVNIISKTYDAANTLTGTTQQRYRISSTGAWVPVSVDIITSTGIHLIFN